jgi:transposase
VLIRPSDPSLAVFVCLEPVDFRKQAASLAALVQVQLEHDPFSNAIYCFTNRRRNAVKLLVWERNGHVLWHKRLERERFHWPRPGAGEPTVALSVQELNWLLDGLDLRRWQPHAALHYQYAA